MATLVAQTLSPSAGITPTYAAASVGGDELPADGRTWLAVVNASGGSITVTAVSTITVSGLTVQDPTFTVGAGVTKWLGPFDGSIYGNASGRVAITYSAVTTVTVGVFVLP